MNGLSDSQRPGPYRSRRGMFLGVCRGIAEYFDVSVFWFRMGAIAVFVFTGVWPTVAVYVLAGVMMKKEPVVTFASDSDREFYDSYAANRGLALQRINRIYQRLDRRIQRIESRVTAKDFDWDRRMQGY